MARIPVTRIPVPISGTNRTHKTLLAFTEIASTPTLSPRGTEPPTRSDLENAHGIPTEESVPKPASDQLMSLKDILSAPAPTPLEQAMARPFSGDFGRIVNIYDSEGGWSQRDVRKGGLSKLRVAHDAAKVLGGLAEAVTDEEEDDGELWTEAEKGRELEGYEGAAAAVLAGLKEVAALQGSEKGKGRGRALGARLRKKLGKKEISWPLTEQGPLGTMAAVRAGTREIEKMANQARKENRVARVEQIALRVQDLVYSLRE